MEKFLVVVDMQNDFINGALGTQQAQSIVDNVVNKINCFDGKIIATYDTHSADYLFTSEGKNLPVEHCIKGTYGFELNEKVENALRNKGYVRVEKSTFGCLELPKIISESAKNDDISIEFVGVCTDICVISNALIVKAAFPTAEISADSNCCAGVTPQLHQAAFDIMRSCQIKVY